MDLVLIKGFREVPASTRARRGLSHTDCMFDVFDDTDAGRVLELATTGSDARVNSGKRSQTIQLDKAGAVTLLGLLEEAFGDALYELPEEMPDIGTLPSAGTDRGMPVDLNWSTESIIVLPEMRHGLLRLTPEVVPDYEETQGDVLVSAMIPSRTRAPSTVNRAIELSAIELVKRTFERSGWTFHADRQRDGVGYDLEFVNGDELRKVEVKGIRGEVLAFNMTRKELSQAQKDPEFVLVAVTGALDEGRRRVHVVPREIVVNAQRVTLSYRVGPLALDRDGDLKGDEASEEDAWH